MNSKCGVMGLGETDWSKARYFSITQILIEMNCCHVSIDVLTVVISEGDVVVGMDRNLLNIQNNVPLLSALLGGEVSSLKLPTNDFSVLSRHDLNAGTDPALYLRLSRASNSAYVVTATVWPRVAVLRLTEVDTVSRCHHDEGARGSGEDCSPAVVRLVRFNSQGAEPRIASLCVFKCRLHGYTNIINFFDGVQSLRTCSVPKS